MLDEPGGCWRAVTPQAGRVVFFACETTLHKVEPCYRERFALTAWWNQPNGECANTITIKAAIPSGPGRYAMVPESAKHDVLSALRALRRQRAEQGRR